MSNEQNGYIYSINASESFFSSVNKAINLHFSFSDSAHEETIPERKFCFHNIYKAFQSWSIDSTTFSHWVRRVFPLAYDHFPIGSGEICHWLTEQITLILGAKLNILGIFIPSHRTE